MSEERLNRFLNKCKAYQEYENNGAIPDGVENVLVKLCIDIENVLNENQQLKEKIEWYKKENRHNQEIIIRDTKVLDEIRKYIEENKENHNMFPDEAYELLQILDKVKE